MTSTPVATRDYGKRLGVLTGEALQTACDRFDLGVLHAAEPVSQGLFGQNVSLATSRGGFVLRGCPHFDWQLPKERLVARMVHEQTTLDAPWPYHVEEDTSLFGWSYALMRRIPGVVDGARNAVEHREVAEALGRALAALHAIAAGAPAYYELSIDAFVPFPMTHEERIVRLVQEKCDEVEEIRAEAMLRADRRWVEEQIEIARPALRTAFLSRFVHHDFKPNNVLCEKTREGFVARGVVDLMEGYFGDPEEDLVRAIGSFAGMGRGLAQAFVAAYRTTRPLRVGYRERYRLYQLYDCLVVWEYGQRNRVWFPPGRSFDAFARPLVELDPFGGS